IIVGIVKSHDSDGRRVVTRCFLISTCHGLQVFARPSSLMVSQKAGHDERVIFVLIWRGRFPYTL
ncbi:MAG: hypothetical protein ACOY4H_06075, partial [Thermodesulfobacteriota bacterium]